MTPGSHPMWAYLTAAGLAIGAWLKFRLGRWDQQAVRITKLEARIDDLQLELRELVDLKIDNALLRAENVRLVAENDALKAAAHQRRASDVL